MGTRATTDARLAHIREVADRVAESSGVVVFDAQLRRESVGLVLRITIDRPFRRDETGRPIVERPEDSIGIEECQRVSHDVSAILDVEDALDAAYTLEVSVPRAGTPAPGPRRIRPVRGPDGEDRRPEGD